jgi:CheY-like chemotaxis protein
LTAESEEGCGSRFCFTLQTGPLEGVRMLDRPGPPAPRLDQEQPKPKPAPLEGVRILLAEDGRDNQRLITKILSVAGAKVELVENGALAVESTLAAASAGRPFDVIFMDMQMPVMDGYTAVRNLRQQGYRARIVAITANAMKGDREKCLEAGCDEFLSKPVTRASLISAVAEDEDRD